MGKEYVNDIKIQIPKRIKNIFSNRYGKLTVVSFAYRENKKTYWNCKCDCGNTKIANANSLQCGSLTSCGCNKINNLVGQYFGKLYVESFLYLKSHKAYWNCVCDCKNTQIVSRERLISGLATMCNSCSLRRPKRILSGKKFGYLTAEDWVIKNDRIYWICACDCGNKNEVRPDHLKCGKTLSCGCKKQSLMEKTNLKKYGVKSVMHDPEIATKNASRGSNIYEMSHWKTGEKLLCKASWEKRVVEYFNNNRINFLWQPKIFNVLVDGKECTYRPDFYLFSIKKWIEIKGYEYEISMKKFNYFHKYVKTNSEIWNKGKLLEMKIL